MTTRHARLEALMTPTPQIRWLSLLVFGHGYNSPNGPITILGTVCLLDFLGRRANSSILTSSPSLETSPVSLPLESPTTTLLDFSLSVFQANISFGFVTVRL